MGTYRLASLGTLGDPTRRLIFETLAAGPLSVGELAQRLPISRPAVSQHLRALKEAGLVVDRPDGTRRIYRVNPAGVAQLRAYLDQIWGDALAAFKSVVEAGPETEEPDERPSTANTANTANRADTTNRADAANEAKSDNKEES